MKKLIITLVTLLFLAGTIVGAIVGLSVKKGNSSETPASSAKPSESETLKESETESEKETSGETSAESGTVSESRSESKSESESEFESETVSESQTESKTESKNPYEDIDYDGKNLILKDNGDGTYKVARTSGVLGNLVIPSKAEDGKIITEIAENAFRGCTDLISVVIPDTITVIGDGAFYQCKNLKKVEFGKDSKLTSIGRDAFLQAEKLTSIDLPESLKTIGATAFRRCAELREVTFGNSLTEIQARAFDECAKLTVYNYRGTKEEFSAIKKYSLWSGRSDKAARSAEYAVKCIDGEIAWKDAFDWIKESD